MRITLIHNPAAGDDQSPSGDELIEFIQHEGYTVGYQSSKDENSLSCPHAHPSDGLLDIVFVSAGEQDKLSMCLSDCIDGKLARPALTVRKGQQLQVEWDGFTVHIDDEVWPDKGSAFPLSPNLIDITVRRHALQFLVTP